MIPSRPRPLETTRHARMPLILNVIAGVATAGVAGYYLGSALTDLKDCGKTAPGAGCASHPIWGFSPELFVTACLVGVAVGALLVVVGVLAHWGRLPSRVAGLAVIALGIIGTVAYAGFGLGAAAAVAAGVLWAFPRRPVPGSPAEWSGSLPVGVPPAPRPSGRALPDRPSVTEWQGAVAAARMGPPGASRARANLPTADRLADALRRSRLSAAQTGSDAYPSPIIVLPPPPLGLRAMVGSARSSAVGSAPGRALPPLGVGPGPAATAQETGQPGEAHPGHVSGGPAEGAAGAPPLPVRAGASAAPGSPRPVETPGEATPLHRRAPLREFRAPGPDGRTEATTGRPGTPEGGPIRPTRVLAIDLSSSGVGSSSPAPDRPPEASVPPRARSPPPPTQPSSRSPGGGPPSTSGPTPSERTLPPEVETSLRPPQPSAATPKPRTRAWRCPKCRLVNAPWTPRCTRCKTEAPVVG